MRVLHLGQSADDDRRWDEYVGPRSANVADSAAWRRVVQETHGLRSWLLAAVEGERIVGTLGLYEARHPIFGHYLATAAFVGNASGLYFDDAAARDALLAEARSVAESQDVDYLVIRTLDVELEGFKIDGHYRTAILDLAGGADSVWKNAVGSKARNQVRKGQKEGFTISTGADQRVPFFDVFHEHMRDLGSPAHGMRFYEAVAKHLGDRAEFYVVRDGRALVGGALLFWTNGTAMNLHTVALHRYNPRCPNYALYWKMIEESCARGCARFDMGRSEEGGHNLAFKMHWGPAPVRLCYNYHLRKGHAMPYVDPRNPRYRFLIGTWKRLPVALTKSLGPRLISGLL
jgi:FemAB-related protein (PEP-CTERM system-associated)